ncbi:MAG: phenylacetate-CoA oxygenase/reductase subunit PaaK [Chitinophagaceae bacterium]|nr:phenylacetate-CoA oxygenase/reductase subunit PaaK [Chitinophagaceae bacterium]
MTQFHLLAIKDIRQETKDCISIAFDIPEYLKDKYSFQPGQNITLKLNVEGEELRRSYSICSSPLDNELRVAIKKISAGKFSTHANHQLQKGDTIEVLPPTGKFNPHLHAENTGNYVAFAAGSGITPIISIIKTTLATEAGSRFTLVYGNRSRGSIIFKEQLEALKNKYMDRFAVHHVFSRETTDAYVNHGRINAEKCETLAPWLIDPENLDQAFICGPEEMIFTTRDWLQKKGLEKSKIHFELFTVPGQQIKTKSILSDNNSERAGEVSLKLDGAVISFRLQFDGPSILDATLQQGADLPFACKGGVCATCRAKLIEGKVEMDNNYALESEELEQGYILTCQSHPVSERVFIDFDEK